MSISSHDAKDDFILAPASTKPFLYFAWGERVKYDDAGNLVGLQLEHKNSNGTEQKALSKSDEEALARKTQAKQLAIEATTPAVLRKIENALKEDAHSILSNQDEPPTLKQVMFYVKSILGETEYTPRIENIAKIYLQSHLIQFVEPTVDIYVDPQWDNDLIRIEEGEKNDLLKSIIAVLAVAFEHRIHKTDTPTTLFLSRVVKNENDFDIWFINNTNVNTTDLHYTGETHAPRKDDLTKKRKDGKATTITTFGLTPPKQYRHDTFFYPLVLTGLQTIEEAEKNNTTKLYLQTPSLELQDSLGNRKTPEEMAMLDMTGKNIFERIIKKAMQSSDTEIKDARQSIDRYKAQILAQNQLYKKLLENTEKADAELLPRAEHVNLDYKKLNTEIAQLKANAELNHQRAEEKANTLTKEFEAKVLEQYSQFKERCEDKSIFAVDLANILNEAITEFVKKKVKGSQADKAKAIQEINKAYEGYLLLDEKGNTAQIIEQNTNTKNRKILLDKMNAIMKAFSPKSFSVKVWDSLFSNDLFQFLKNRIDKYIKENPQGVVKLVQSELPPILLADENKIATLIQTSAAAVVDSYKKKLIEEIKEIKLNNETLEAQTVKIEQLEQLLQQELQGLKKIRQDRIDLDTYVREIEAKNNPKQQSAMNIMSPYGLTQDKLSPQCKFALEEVLEADTLLQTKIQRIKSLTLSFTYQLSIGNAAVTLKQINLLKERVEDAEKKLDAAIQKWNTSFNDHLEEIRKKLNKTFNVISKILLGCPYFWSKQQDTHKEYVKINGSDYKVSTKIKNLMKTLQSEKQVKSADKRIKNITTKIKNDFIDNMAQLHASLFPIKEETKEEAKDHSNESSPLIPVRKPSIFSHITHTTIATAKPVSLIERFTTIIINLIRAADNNIYDEAEIDKIVMELNSFYELNKQQLEEKRPQSSFCSSCCFPANSDDRGIEYDDVDEISALAPKSAEKQKLLRNADTDSEGDDSTLVGALENSIRHRDSAPRTNKMA